MITRKHEQKLSSFEIVEGIKIFRFPKTKLYHIWYWIYNRRSLIRNADIVHCHDFATFIYWYLPFRLIYPFKPVYITFHGYEGILPIPRKIIFLRKVAELSTKGNICIGDFIPKWYGTKADIVSYGGAEDSLPHNELLSSRRINKNSATFVGRLEKDTGIIAYIETVKVLKLMYSIDLHIDVCGDGSLRDMVEKKIGEHDLDIKLYGFVENPINYIINSNFAFASGYLTILEAMANKKLVFNIFENDLKKDYLTLIPKADDIMISTSSPQELAERIEFYIKNPEKANEKIENAYTFAKKQTWEKVGNKYLQLWGYGNG